MPPQQNSTLIDDSLAVCPSLLNLPEILQRYSPILPASALLAEDSNNNNSNSNSNNNDYENDNSMDAVKQQELRQLSPLPEHRHQQRKLKHYRSGSSRHGRRSRSISLYGINSTVEQGNKEIPIWIGDETRYVSGVTNKTTCNDIIKALIDDEYRDEGNNADEKDGAASRDYSDYVITESWRGIERSYDGNMAILPVWKAWSRVHNELRLTMKHHKDIQDPSKPIKTKKGFSAIRKYFRKLLNFGKTSKKEIKPSTSAASNKTKENCLLSSKAQIPDEFIFVILPDNLYDKNKESLEKDVQHKSQKVRNKNIKPTNEESAQQAEAKLLKEKLYRLSETRASMRKRRAISSAASSLSTTSRVKRKEKKAALLEKRRSLEDNNYIRRRKDAPMRNCIRNKLAQKTSEVDELYEREYALTKTLTNKCKLYKLQNELYKNPEKQLEISVGEIQHNIEAYAKEIIQTEHELLELKRDIREDISIINNLKRLTLDSGTIIKNECGVPMLAAREKVEMGVAYVNNVADQQMQFVDNIYEFCDNNASMLI